MSATWQIVVAFGTVFVTALMAPWFARRASAKENERQRNEDNERRAASADSAQIDRLFTEQDRMRRQYIEDIKDLRERLGASETAREKQGNRIGVLEQEVAEWRAGVRGVHGVWIAVPASVWEYVRGQLPDLPQTRFPGEADGELPPLNL